MLVLNKHTENSDFFIKNVSISLFIWSLLYVFVRHVVVIMYSSLYVTSVVCIHFLHCKLLISCEFPFSDYFSLKQIKQTILVELTFNIKKLFRKEIMAQPPHIKLNGEVVTCDDILAAAQNLQIAMGNPNQDHGHWSSNNAETGVVTIRYQLGNLTAGV